MRYIGPFFRMNSLSHEEISTQLFFLSKEAVKTIVLESKCGIVASGKSYKRLSTTKDTSAINSFSPLLCVYRKASPNFIHSKNSNGFDEDSFKKEINPSTNALMTLCLLELMDYYRDFQSKDKNIYSLYNIYTNLAKEQLEFYSENLRNAEGVFTDKKNLFESNFTNYNLVDKDKKFKFSDQAFMMLAYYLYSLKQPSDEMASAYKTFALEILQVFIDYKEKIYENSLDELCKILLSYNILFSYDENSDVKELIIDLADFIMSKFDEKDYYVSSLDTTALCCITLSLSYKHTHMLSFFDKATEIIERLYSLYDSDKEAFYKLSSKKDIKYSSFDIIFYFLAFVIYSELSENKSKYKNMISSIYKKFFINSGLITSWPEAPTLDDYERYSGLTLKASDMLNESYFRMPNIATPDTTGIAPIFLKSINYNKRKDEFSKDRLSFDSYRNFMIFYSLIFLFKRDYIKNYISKEPLKVSDLESISSSIESESDIKIREETNNISTTNIDSSTSSTNEPNLSSNKDDPQNDYK